MRHACNLKNLRLIACRENGTNGYMYANPWSWKHTLIVRLLHLPLFLTVNIKACIINPFTCPVLCYLNSYKKFPSLNDLYTILDGIWSTLVECASYQANTQPPSHHGWTPWNICLLYVSLTSGLYTLCSWDLDYLFTPGQRPYSHFQ